VCARDPIVTSSSRRPARPDDRRTALNSRVIIEQAKGAVARALGLTPEESFAVTARPRRANQLLLTEIAHRIVTEPGAIDQLRDDTSPR
jgi:hypothetical protein